MTDETEGKRQKETDREEETDRKRQKRKDIGGKTEDQS
jgi:hypothetical protein